MASGKRIFGTILIILAFLLTLVFVALLYAKSFNDPNVPWTDDVPTWALVTGFGLGILVIVLLFMLLIRTADERRNRRAEEEEAARLAAEQAARDAFESTLEEPDGLGKGPEIVVYSIGAIPQMYRAWSKYERKTRTYPFVFPRTVESALYTNTYVPIDAQGNQLKLRILLAGPQDGQKAELPIRNSQKPTTEIPPERLKTIPDSFWSKLDPEVRERFFPKPAEEAAEAPAEGEAGEGEAVPHTGKSADGREFIGELEERLAMRKGSANGAERAFYDYGGDIHDVEDIEGIGRIYGEKLREAGVHTTARLAYEEPDALAKRVGVPRKTVEQWQAMGELMRVSGIGKQYAEALARAGIMGIADLKRRSAERMAEQVNQYLESLDTNLVGQAVTAKRIEGWQKAAAKMKKVRVKVPEK